MSECNHLYGIREYDYEGWAPIELNRSLALVGRMEWAEKCLEDDLSHADSERFNYCPRCGVGLPAPERAA